MYELPDELWRIIKDFFIDYKKHHKIKMNIILENDINNRFVEIYSRWTLFPPFPNTSDIIRYEYNGLHCDWTPDPNLELVSITKWPKGNINGSGWWCGYGWRKTKKINNKYNKYYNYKRRNDYNM